MASNLSCVGLAVPDNDALEALVAAVRPRATSIGYADGIDTLRWEDPSSGARLVLGIRSGSVVDLLPSLASQASTNLASVRLANEDVATAAVVAGDGEQLTSLALELEQRRLLGSHVLAAADAAVVALGSSVSIYADDETFAASPDSLMDPNADIDSEPPPHYVDHGMKWPPRMASESFISYGVFGDSAEARAHARLNGVVLTSSLRTTVQTGQSFVVARVRTVGFEVDLCMNADEHPNAPQQGQIIGGQVFLVGSVPSLERTPSRKRWWHRR